MKSDKCLLCAISKGELLSGKKQWTHRRIDKASGQFINKADAKYKQYDLNEKGEKTGKAFGYTWVVFLTWLKSKVWKNWWKILRIIQ